MQGLHGFLAAHGLHAFLAWLAAAAGFDKLVEVTVVATAAAPTASGTIATVVSNFIFKFDMSPSKMAFS